MKNILDSKIEYVQKLLRMIEVENCRGVRAAAKFFTSRVLPKIAEEYFSSCNTEDEDNGDQSDKTYFK